MRKVIYTLFLLAGFAASSFGIGKQDAQGGSLTLGKEPVTRAMPSGGLLVFSDVLDLHTEGALVAGHYSHRSHSSHSSHRSHYSSRY